MGVLHVYTLFSILLSLRTDEVMVALEGEFGRGTL